MTIYWKAVEQYFTVKLLIFQLIKCIILDTSLSGVKGLMDSIILVE